VTGLGLVSPVGNNVADSWNAILAGTNGIGPITRFDASALKARMAGEVKGFNVADYLSPKEARRMDVFIHYGMAAGIQAFRESGIVVTEENAHRIGVNIGSGIGGLPMIEETHNDFLAGGPRKISPFFIPGTIINMISGNLSIMLGLKGPNLAVVTACTTGLHAIGTSFRMIQYGDGTRRFRARRGCRRDGAGRVRTCQGAWRAYLLRTGRLRHEWRRLSHDGA
jgi:3-oxoacyl-[acyl-carrier-protein] synthase II